MERAIYVLAAAVLLHALATFWGGQRYTAMSDPMILDTRSGDVWVGSLENENPLARAKFYELRFDQQSVQQP
jgi:hypothetical protein